MWFSLDHIKNFAILILFTYNKFKWLQNIWHNILGRFNVMGPFPLPSSHSCLLPFLLPPHFHYYSILNFSFTHLQIFFISHLMNFIFSKQLLKIYITPLLKNSKLNKHWKLHQLLNHVIINLLPKQQNHITNNNSFNFCCWFLNSKMSKCTKEWLTFVTFFSFYSTHLVLLSPSKTYSVKFFNWDLVLDYQLDYENICIIISWKKIPHFYLWTFETKN